jgi:type IV secretion system protein VirD4
MELVKRFALRASVFLLPALIGLQIATQMVARTYGYHPALGASLAWHIYAPWHFAGWLWRFGFAQPEVFRTPMYAVYGGLVVGVVGLLALIGIGKRGQKQALTTFGSARWGTQQDIQRSGLL